MLPGACGGERVQAPAPERARHDPITVTVNVEDKFTEGDDVEIITERGGYSGTRERELEDIG
jgi:hypothetical protein